MQTHCDYCLRSAHHPGNFRVLQFFEITEGKHLGRTGIQLGKFQAKPLSNFDRGMRAFRRKAGIGLQFVRGFDWYDLSMAPGSD
jgi:hypothetical protein